MHLFALNRSVLLTLFHKHGAHVAAMTKNDLDRHAEVFREAVLELTRTPRS